MAKELVQVTRVVTRGPVPVGAGAGGRWAGSTASQHQGKGWTGWQCRGLHVMDMEMEMEMDMGHVF